MTLVKVDMRVAHVTSRAVVGPASRLSAWWRSAVVTWVSLGLTAASLALASGCGVHQTANEPVGQPTAVVSPSPSSEPGEVAQRDAVLAYRSLWDVFVETARTSDAESPSLRKYAAGQALKLIAGSLYTDQQQHYVTQGQVQLDPKVSAAKPVDAPTEVTITDCVSDEKWLKYKANGDLVDDVPGGRHATTATVARDPDGWKVTKLLLREAGTC